MSTYANTPTRSEAEVGAEVLFTLLDARLLHPDQLNRALALTGLTLEDIAAAKMRADNGRARPPRRVEAWANVEPTREDGCYDGAPVATGAIGYFPNRDSATSAAPATNIYKGASGSSATKLASIPRPPDPGRDQTRRARNPVPKAKPHVGERFCSTCGLWLDEGEFAAERATCRGCLNSRRRQRYLSVEREAEVERSVLRWVRAQNDPAVRCSVCAQMIDVDEECVMVGDVRHAGCGTSPGLSPTSSPSVHQGKGRIINS